MSQELIFKKCNYCDKEITWKKVMGPDGKPEKKPDGSDKVRPYERDGKEHSHSRSGAPRKLKFSAGLERSIPFTNSLGKEEWIKIKLEKEYYEGERTIAQAFDEIDGALEVELGVIINRIAMKVMA